MNKAHTGIARGRSSERDSRDRCKVTIASRRGMTSADATTVGKRAQSTSEQTA